MEAEVGGATSRERKRHLGPAGDSPLRGEKRQAKDQQGSYSQPSSSAGSVWGIARANITAIRPKTMKAVKSVLRDDRSVNASRSKHTL